MAIIIILVLMLVVMYFLLIRPQRAQQRKTQDMLANLAPGDEVITIGGIYGDVVDVDEDKVTLEIAEDVHIEITRRAVASIVQEPEPVDEPEESDETEEADSGDAEEAAADDEVPVVGERERSGSTEIDQPAR